MINKYRISTIVIFLVVIGLMGVACKKKAVNPFPESGTVAGWEKGEKTRVFDAANLWQYIDGDAEQYLKAGVVTTSTSDYKFHGQLEATVDVYTMKDANGAKTVFESDPQSGGATAQLGDASRVYGQSVVFRKGPYLVRIVAFEPGEGASNALVALAHGVEARLQ